MGGDQGVIIPYYFPINQSTDILFKPKISLNQIFEFMEKYELNTILQNKTAGGDTNISIDSIKRDGDKNINTSLKIDSDNIKKENNVVYFYNNFLTPCELKGYFNCPTWSLRIDKTKYEIKQDKFTHFDTFL